MSNSSLAFTSNSGHTQNHLILLLPSTHTSSKEGEGVHRDLIRKTEKDFEMFRYYEKIIQKNITPFHSTDRKRLRWWLDLFSSGSNIMSHEEMVSKIEVVLSNVKEYATADYISGKTGIRIDKVQEILDTEKQFQKSIMSTKEGKPIYRMKTWFSRLIDIWKTFLYINYLKY